MDTKAPFSNIIYEDEALMLLLPSTVISKGHVIIQPKQNYKDLDELPEALLKQLLLLTQCYVRIMKQRYRAKGYSLMHNAGKKYESEPFSIHVFPRYNKADFCWTYSEETNEEAKAFERIKQLLKQDFKILFES